MNTHDRVIAWKRKRLYIPVAQAGNGSLSGLTMTQLVGSVYGLKLAAAGTPTEFSFKVPADLNPDFPLGIRVHWSSGTASTTVTTVSWVALLVFKAIDAVLTGAGAGALDTVITLAQAVSATAKLNNWSSRGLKTMLGVLTRAQILGAGGAMGHLSINLSAAGGTIDSSNAIWLLGVELDYVPMKTKFPHSENDAPYDDAPPTT